ncbi:hypothetical protein TeGR_g4100 [Tetraparma gracilis]|uniref:PH domain-containing protein n=1 Tax=Tetraparma gracilis TaxID=2962635 RepID=A0ABQ6N4F6_9STRA|nr:hypothetical protein TeGR_g4100 [Tetraparma gracilis]
MSSPVPPPSPSSGPSVKRGTLHKQRDYRSGWPTRLFVLDPPLLHYYLEPSDPSPRKTIYIVGCAITSGPNPLPDPKDPSKHIHPFSISHPASAKAYSLAAGSAAERDAWVTLSRLKALAAPALPLTDQPPLTGAAPWRPLFEKRDKGVVAASIPGACATVRGDAVMPFPPLQVFATVIAGWVIEPKSTPSGLHSSVKVIVCSDLKGALPGKVVAQVTQQQAMFPVIIGKYMKETQPRPPPRLTSEEPLTDALVIENVIKHLPAELNVPPPGGAPAPPAPRPTISAAAPPAPSAPAAPPTPVSAPVPPPPSSASLGVNIPVSPLRNLSKPSLTFSALALFLPVLLWALAKYKFRHLAPLRGFLFSVGLACGLRIFCQRRLGTAMSYTDGSSVGLCGNGNGGTGAVTCSFSVDLKKMMRYIEARRTTSRRAGDSSKKEASPLAVTHIALKACAIVLQEISLFNGRSVKLPLLGINGYYPNASVDVSTSAGRSENGTKRIVKLVDAHELSVADIAQQIQTLLAEKTMAAKSITRAILPGFIRAPLEVLSEQLDLAVPGLGLNGRNFGSALVVTSPNQTEGSEVAVTVAPMPPPAQKAGGPQIIVVVGGVQILPGFTKQPGSAVARPVLNVSVTIDCGVANVATCRMFAERLQGFMREPELMDAESKKRK